MTDNEKNSALTDAEIIKALEHCSQHKCNCECPKYYDTTDMDICITRLIRSSFDLINRLQTDKEALIAGQETLQKALAESEANFKEAAKRFYKEGVTDFAERLKNVYTSDKRYDRPYAHTSLTMLFYNIEKVSKDLAGDTE